VAKRKGVRFVVDEEKEKKTTTQQRWKRRRRGIRLIQKTEDNRERDTERKNPALMHKISSPVSVMEQGTGPEESKTGRLSFTSRIKITGGAGTQLLKETGAGIWEMR